MLGLEKEALAFYEEISRAEVVSARSRMFWERAAHRQLNLSPDIHENEADLKDPNIGPRFLFNFERKRKQSEKTLQESTEQRHDEEALQFGQGEDSEGEEEKSEEEDNSKIIHTEEAPEDTRRRPKAGLDEGANDTDIDENDVPQTATRKA